MDLQHREIPHFVLKFLSALVFLFITACSSTPKATPSEAATPAAEQKPNAPPVTEVQPEVAETKKVAGIENEALEKARPLFEAIIKNDDKKAKLAYGRAVRHLPEIVQFAVDLRFKNYEHALAVLPKAGLADDQREFWQKVISKKPPKLSAALCQELASDEKFPAAGVRTPDDQASWLRSFDEIGNTLANPSGALKETSELDKELSRVVCAKECSSMADDVRKDILSDSFFDKLHNMRRRDTRFYSGNYKNILKMKQYRPYVSDMNVFKLWRALKVTPFDKQMHFIRRFKSIARDMRSDFILSRSIGDLIIEDDKDLALAKRLGLFLTSNPFITAVTRAEAELPSCHLK